MTRRNFLTATLALVMLAGVVGTYSMVSADDEGDRLAEPPIRQAGDLRRDGDQPQRPLLAQTDEERRERERRQQAERQEQQRRMREEQERRMMEERQRRGGERGDEMRPPFRPEHAEQFGRMIELIERMKRTCFDPEAAAVVAIGGIRDDVPRDPGQVIDDLEGCLAKTKTLGLRNALRLQLRDLYRETDQPKRILEHMRKMLGENDQALQAGPPKPKPEPER